MMPKKYEFALAICSVDLSGIEFNFVEQEVKSNRQMIVK